VTYDAWKIVHVFAAFLLFTSLGTLIGLEITADAAPGARKLAGALHGVSLLIMVVAGAAPMGQLGIHGRPPGWILLKAVIWIALGGAPVLIRRGASLRTAMTVLLPLLGLLATWAAIAKPF